jgi:ribosome-binding ATPase YchF (GTP1/OBG family)
MLIGVVGAPNKGKSTFFSAATLVDAAIANYPFTTITPSKAVTYLSSQCPHVALGLRGCNPKNSKCVDGVRLVPVGIVDVPGLVPDAHKGKGLGNRFLDSIREADALIQVVDGTGRTDLQGNACVGCDPLSEVEFLEEELARWMAEIMLRDGNKVSGGGASELAKRLSGLRISYDLLVSCAQQCGLDVAEGAPDEEGAFRLSMAILAKRMTITVAFNKIDAQGAMENFQKAGRSGAGHSIFACSAAVELALRKAHAAGFIRYLPGGTDFEIIGSPDEQQLEALGRMRSLLKLNGGSGVQRCIDEVVRKKLHGIVVYPVEDEHRFSNHKGEVLPDAFLVPQGTTAQQLAGMVHTDLASRFIGAVDAKRHIRVGADHVLLDGDVIKIVAGR